MRRFIVLSLSVVLVWLSTAGCRHHSKPRREEGRRVKVRAPFTHVDVYVPDDDRDKVDVRVDVDD